MDEESMFRSTREVLGELLWESDTYQRGRAVDIQPFDLPAKMSQDEGSTGDDDYGARLRIKTFCEL